MPRPLTRRSLVVGAIVGSAALSGCSIKQLTTRREEDPEAADRARITRARDLSAQLSADVARVRSSDSRLARLQAVHGRQIAEFERSAGAGRPTPLPSAGLPVSSKTLIARERELAVTLRALALQAQRGDVAALLASAAAGIEQALVA